MNSEGQRILATELEQHQTLVGEAWGGFRAIRGSRHILDGATPAIGFLLGYSVASAEVGIFIAILIAVASAAVRVMRGDSVRVVAASVSGILEPADSAIRLRRHRRITLARFVFWAVLAAVMVPLYLANKLVILGTVALILGKPALVVMLAVTWLWGCAQAPRPSGTGGSVLESEAI
ncbi:hypothetical protein ACQP1G_11530 [Nocardia sp. CA-107356]|uniref:hypothetical protein n=1 Tax=Nocardia sp. CA-107356 TaxID=3239972 RepID=UPI003D8B146A